MAKAKAKEKTINEQIKGHFSYKKGVNEEYFHAFSITNSQVPYFINFKRHIKNFFNTDHNSSRLTECSKITASILHYFDLDILKELRTILANDEILLKMKYKNQTEHTIHTLYLFLFGIFVIDNCSFLNTELNKTHTGYLKIDTNTDFSFDSNFLFGWVIAGLMHDIGYLFENNELLNEELVTKLNSLLDIEITNNYQKSFCDCMTCLQNTLPNHLIEKIKKWKDLELFPRFTPHMSNFDLLNNLQKAPWISDLLSLEPNLNPKRIFELFDLLHNQNGQQMVPYGIDLMRYAMQVATNGYKGDSTTGNIDHAFVSGCLLLQLISLRYWVLLNQDPSVTSSEFVLNTEFGMFKYSLSQIPELIYYCHASASHNLNYSNNFIRKNNLLPLHFNNQPLLFFSVLLDELQQWHRSPIGLNNIKEISIDRVLSPKDFSLVIPQRNTRRKLFFRLKRRRKSIWNKVNKKLQSADYEVFMTNV